MRPPAEPGYELAGAGLAGRGLSSAARTGAVLRPSCLAGAAVGTPPMRWSDRVERGLDRRAVDAEAVRERGDQRRRVRPARRRARSGRRRTVGVEDRLDLVRVDPQRLCELRREVAGTALGR